MKKEESFLKRLLMLGIVCSSISVTGMNLPKEEETVTGSSSPRVQELSIRPQEVEDDVVWVPSQKNREDFLKNEGFIVDYNTQQSYTGYSGEGIPPKFGLSIDGGGIRGLMPALWLTKLEEELEREGHNEYLSDVFDCIGGTSIGGIIALGIGGSDRANTLVELLKDRGREIFPVDWLPFAPMSKIHSLWEAHYSELPLEEILKNHFVDNFFDDKRFSDLSTDVVVTACTTKGEPKLFKKETDGSAEIWEIARCTSAAPSYFPAYRLNESNYIDGGMWMNNPTSLVMSRIISHHHDKKFAPQKIYMLSLGTGKMEFELPSNVGLATSTQWGITPRTVINILMESSSNGCCETVETILGNDNYYRINPDLPRNIELSNSDERSIEDLERTAAMEECNDEIKRFVETFVDVKRKA